MSDQNQGDQPNNRRKMNMRKLMLFGSGTLLLGTLLNSLIVAKAFM